MDCVIIGSGPTGLSLAYFLEKTKGYRTTVVEKDRILGGSWNAKLTSEEYFTENSPRVQFGSGVFLDFLKYTGVFEQRDVSPIYGDRSETISKFFNFASSNFSIKDFLMFFQLFVRSNLYLLSDASTVDDLLEYYSFTPEAKKAIKTLCITVNDVPTKTNSNDFLKSLGVDPQFVQFKDPNKWHKEIEKLCTNTTFMKSTELLEIIPDSTGFDLLVRSESSGLKTLRTKKCILAIDATSLPKILDGSQQIRDNWLPYEDMKKWCNKSTYGCFSFQLHFDTSVEYKEEWCWSCMGDWTIIILPVSNWLASKYFPSGIKTIWSCTVVDLKARSNKTGKSCNECDKSEATVECLRQINELYSGNIPAPFNITYDSGLRKENGEWVSSNTGFTRGGGEFLKSKGKTENLFYVGPHNPRRAGITEAGVAVESSVEYMRNYETEIIILNKTKLIYNIIFYLLLFYFFYLTVKNYLKKIV